MPSGANNTGTCCRPIQHPWQSAGPLLVAGAVIGLHRGKREGERQSYQCHRNRWRAVRRVLEAHARRAASNCFTVTRRPMASQRPMQPSPRRQDSQAATLNVHCDLQFATSKSFIPVPALYIFVFFIIGERKSIVFVFRYKQLSCFYADWEGCDLPGT